MTVDVQLSEESMTVLLVGGAGYVGCVLAQELLIRGHTVRVYVPYGPDWRAYSTRRMRKNPQMFKAVTKSLLFGE